MNRRQFIATTYAAVASAGCTSLKQHPEKQIPIVDTHQHFWNLDRFKLNWLDEAPAVLKRSFRLNDYLAATKGLNIAKAIYLEVDVIPEQQKDEANFVMEISKNPKLDTMRRQYNLDCTPGRCPTPVTQMLNLLQNTTGLFFC